MDQTSRTLNLTLNDSVWMRYDFFFLLYLFILVQCLASEVPLAGSDRPVKLWLCYCGLFRSFDWAVIIFISFFFFFFACNFSSCWRYKHFGSVLALCYIPLTREWVIPAFVRVKNKGRGRRLYFLEWFKSLMGQFTEASKQSWWLPAPTPHVPIFVLVLALVSWWGGSGSDNGRELTPPKTKTGVWGCWQMDVGRCPLLRQASRAVLSFYYYFSFFSPICFYWRK